jgi:hypothetical protein
MGSWRATPSTRGCPSCSRVSERTGEMIAKTNALDALFRAHPAGSTRAACAQAAGIEEAEVGRVLVELRKQAPVRGQMAEVFEEPVTGQWLYGYCGLLEDHHVEHHKRWRDRYSRFTIDVAMYEVSVLQYPTNLALQASLDQAVSSRADAARMLKAHWIALGRISPSAQSRVRMPAELK